MQLHVRREALELTLRVLLSCRCPVSADEERALFDLLTSLEPEGLIDHARLLSAFPAEASSPLHRLCRFTTWMLPAGDPAIVEREHVLRHFASSYHWDAVVSGASGDAAWCVGHMLLPVTLATGADGGVEGRYEHADGAVVLRGLFLPPELGVAEGGGWAVHLAAVLGRLAPGEERLVRSLGEATPELVALRHSLTEIDYRRTAAHGDYQALCARRHVERWPA